LLLLKAQVEAAALARLKEEEPATLRRFEGGGAVVVKNKSYAGPGALALATFTYYKCHECKEPYFGGNYVCQAANAAPGDPAELVCGACSPMGKERACPEQYELPVMLEPIPFFAAAPTIWSSSVDSAAAWRATSVSAQREALSSSL
jgi:hypothetical protein